MITQTLSAALVGIQATLVTIETEVTQGMSAWNIVGLPDTSVQEARARIRSAIKESGLAFPYNFRITTNLAPAETKKGGAAFDVGIALGVVAKQLELRRDLREFIALGELGLTGVVRPVRGVLACARMAAACGIHEMFVPEENAAEAALVSELKIFPVRTLGELLHHLCGDRLIGCHVPPARDALHASSAAAVHSDFADIAGNEFAKRALEIAAAGSHHILLSGSPGSGKTLLARAMPSILPPLTETESLEVTQIYSTSGGGGEINVGALPIFHPPFRMPHHTTTAAALIGGGSSMKPGELTLAHHGVLFLDEFSEFERAVLEQLREPLESGAITLHRAGYTVELPTRCMLVAAQNPCPCGFASHPKKFCVCTASDLRRYKKKISGPLLDRFDIFVDVAPLDTRELMEGKKMESSAIIQARVIAARTILKNLPAVHDPRAAISLGGKKLLLHAAEQLQLSGRGVTKVTRVAQTIAALNGRAQITESEISEALQYRQLI